MQSHAGFGCQSRNIAALVLAVIGSGFSPANAATLVVTNANDSGPGSLRQAIADSEVGGVIGFNPSLSGATIHLASTLTVDKGLTIDGSMLASKITLSGDSDASGTADVRVLHTTAVDPVTLKNLVIARGYSTNAGGGIRASGSDLAIVNCRITASVARNGAGIFSEGAAISITRSTISGNTATETVGGGGGGMMVYPAGTATIRDSTISGNFASSEGVAGNDGAGIFNLGILYVINSTITSNYANGSGGGIWNSGISTVNVYNSTIAVNFANGDDSNGGGAGGVYNNGGTVNIRNTILAKNLVGNGTYDDCGGTISSYGRNLIGALATTTSGTCTIITGSGSWTPLNAIAWLGPFQDNGGPTPTVALQPGSNAIDGGDPVLGCVDFAATLPADQRGVLRPKGPNCDIGAFEYSAPSDPDGDGIDDALDNCLDKANTDQCDGDGDGYGNRCDGDMNNNGSTNAQDTVLFRQQLGQPSVAPGFNTADLNCNGSVNAQDTTLFRQLLGSPPGPSGLQP